MNSFFILASLLMGIGILLRGILSPVYFYLAIALAIPFVSRWKRSYLIIFTVLGFLLAHRPAHLRNVEILGYVKNTPDVQVGYLRIWKNGEWRGIKGSFRLKRGNFGEGVYCLGDLSFTPKYPEYSFRGKCFDFPRKLGFFESLTLSIKDRIENFRKIGEDISPRITDMVLSRKRHDVYGSGLTHLFVVSGFHMSLVFIIFRAFMNFFAVRRSLLDFLALIPTSVYLCAVGFSPSSFRAFSMITIRTVFRAVDYPVHPLNVVGISAFVSILMNPWIVASPSFLMSHAAVAGIMIGLESGMNTPMLTFIAFLMSLPISLLFFGAFNPLSPILSLLALPVASLAIFLGISSATLYVLGFEFLSRVLIRGAQPLDRILDGIVKLGNVVPRIEFHGVYNVILSFLMMILVLKVISSLYRV